MVDVTWVCGQGCLPHELRSQDTRDRIILGHGIIRSRNLPLQLICNLLFGHRTNSGSPITPQNHIKETKCFIYHRKGSISLKLVKVYLQCVNTVEDHQCFFVVVIYALSLSTIVSHLYLMEDILKLTSFSF